MTQSGVVACETTAGGRGGGCCEGGERPTSSSPSLAGSGAIAAWTATLWRAFHPLRSIRRHGNVATIASQPREERANASTPE